MYMQSILLSAVAMTLATAASSDLSLSQLIASHPNLSELGKLLKMYPAVDKTIAATGQVTLFAPDDNAIKTWLTTSIGKSDSTSEFAIEGLLKYHVLPKVVYSSDISTTPTFATTLLKDGNVEYQVLEASVEDGNVIITSGLAEESKVVQADLNCTSGVVHVIDKVLTTPPNFLETGLIAGLDDFTGALLKLSGLGSTLEAGSSYTFFAPTDEAFAAIGSAAAKLSSQELAGILKYHVLKGVVYSTDLKDESVETLAGEKVTITLKNGEAFVNAARIIHANVLVDEGVLHVIDSVLNPNNSTAKPDPSAVTAAVQFSGASSANLAALTSTLPSASTYASGLAGTMSVMSAASTPGGAMSSGSSQASSMSGSGASSSTPTAPAATGGAAIATAIIGAVALFGGAALFGNM